jgi:hypothetical protein
MYTAHKRLNPKRIGKYLRGWEIIDDDMRVVRVVKTRKLATLIVKTQKLDYTK